VFVPALSDHAAWHAVKTLEFHCSPITHMHGSWSAWHQSDTTFSGQPTLACSLQHSRFPRRLLLTANPRVQRDCPISETSWYTRSLIESTYAPLRHGLQCLRALTMAHSFEAL
jgi:hypothetical protein